jgi:DNA-binding response OmpR family regulator
MMNNTPALIDDVLSNLSMAVRLSLVAGVQTEQIFLHVQSTITASSSLLGSRSVEYDQFIGALQYDIYRVHFSSMENSLLSLLISHAGRIVPYSVIEKHHSLGRDQARIVIHRIRRRLSTIPGNMDWIKIVRGQGYVFLQKAVFVSFSSDKTLDTDQRIIQKP